MDEQDAERKREIMESLIRRLHERELQAAQLGVNADPIVATEIDDIKKQIAKLKQDLRNTVTSVDNSDISIHRASTEARNRGCSLSVQVILVISLFGIAGGEWAWTRSPSDPSGNPPKTDFEIYIVLILLVIAISIAIYRWSKKN